MKRTVFLLGAGAAADWHGPSTCLITDSLIKSGPLNSDDELIINYIFEYFKKENDDQLNFEGIIDIIEQCYQYWTVKDSNFTINSKLISQDHEFWKKIINHNYTAENQHYNHNVSEEANFFCYLLLHCYSIVIYHIREYSVMTQNLNRIFCDNNDEINTLACSYFSKLSNDNYLRIYSLNYDRVIQAIFQKVGIEFFQGFDSLNIVPSVEEMHQSVDTRRILTVFNEHCVYHLHGDRKSVV